MNDSTGMQGAKARSIGLLGAAAIGIGGMVGGGIFAVLGTAADLARGGTPVAFLLAGVIALLTAYSYARLSVSFPSAGGTVVFLDRAFGVDLLTGTLNLVLWFSYLVTVALYASAFGAYAATFFGSGAAPWLRHLLISTGILLPTAINLFNADLVSRSETAIVVLKLALLAIVVAAGGPHIDTTRLSLSHWSDPLTLVAGGMVIFVAYEGFELIANAGDDVRDPQRTLPRALFGSVAFVLALYVLVACVTVGTLSTAEIRHAQDYALAAAARPSLGHFGFTMVAVSALLATLSAINATIYGNARLGFTLAKDGELPELLERRTWNKPVSGVLVTAGVALLMANLIDLTGIAILGSAGFLLIFAAVNAAAVKLAPSTGAKRGVSLAGMLACSAALITLLAHTYGDDPHALWVLSGVFAGAVVFELVYPRATGRPLRL